LRPTHRLEPQPLVVASSFVVRVAVAVDVVGRTSPLFRFTIANFIIISSIIISIMIMIGSIFLVNSIGGEKNVVVEETTVMVRDDDRGMVPAVGDTGAVQQRGQCVVAAGSFRGCRISFIIMKRWYLIS